LVENRALRGTLERRRENVALGWRIIDNEKHNDICPSSSIIMGKLAGVCGTYRGWDVVCGGCSMYTLNERCSLGYKLYNGKLLQRYV
jgi:hypothetical protein